MMLVKLVDFAKLRKGTSITKKRTVPGDIPVIAGGEKPAYYHNQYNREKNSITVSSSGNAGYVSFHKEPIFASDCFTVETMSEKLVQKYLYYYLKSKQNYIYSLRTNAAQPHIYPSSFLEFEINIPILKVQKEIVKILDNYSSWVSQLTKELECEATARQTQYQYYLQKLLQPEMEDGKLDKQVSSNKFGGGGKFRLKQVCKIKMGSSVNKRFISNNHGEYPVINSGREPLGYICYWNTMDDPIGITSRGAGVGSIIWTTGRYYRGNLNYSCSIINRNILLDRYLYYLLKAMQTEIEALCTYDGIPALNKSSLEKLEINIPSMLTQNKVVTMLDEYTVNYESLKVELESEKKARIQQYEYYREKLLTF